MPRMHTFCLSLLVGTSVALGGCGTNPVTGEREIQFVSEAAELEIGAQQYAPTRQAEGGDLDVVPELTTYVNEVGQKLAAVSDRKLPYEFVVLNNPVPNAWALPGGKIAVNRGLLTELRNEAELAAVLGHEIVHAAARHGAKAQERGTLLQVGLAAATIGAAISGADQNIANLAIQGAGLGAQLIQTRYSREQELESDQYGMKYMKLAGYDPMGAVTLQETFVRLANESGRQQGWLEGLFASHPPSAERVARNKQTASELGSGGVVGADEYAARLKPLTDKMPAYEKYDEALALARKKEYATADARAREAIALLPQEGRFHELRGEIALAQKQARDAIAHYDRAVDLNPDYFGAYLGGGVAQLQAGNRERAEEWLKRSVELLPTAPAAYYLGQIERDKGNRAAALQYYKAAAGSDSTIGRQAAEEFVRLDLPENPGNYIAAAAQLDRTGQLIAVVENRAPIALSDVRVTPVLIDNSGRIVSQGAAVGLRGPLGSGERAAIPAGTRLSPEQLAYVRLRIDGARVADR